VIVTVRSAPERSGPTGSNPRRSCCCRISTIIKSCLRCPLNYHRWLWGIAARCSICSFAWHGDHSNKRVFSFQFSVFSFQFSVFSFQFSVFSFQFSEIATQFVSLKTENLIRARRRTVAERTRNMEDQLPSAAREPASPVAGRC